ncbi:hypothetical protein VNO78_33576 [Psophocarpus tetragonolobus]|uniref:Malectin domain-containing protein n=1 Tax=Psophocarpus tetragonolobus TaxID=3891 RepID=A0AAN9P1E3_PSOTE
MSTITSNNFTGEVPATFARLTTLKEVRISDLNGSDYFPFPPLNNLTNLEIFFILQLQYDSIFLECYHDAECSGYSSTGNFMDNDRAEYSIWLNQAMFSIADAELYMDARVSPISLTYYGFCLENGNYTVNLHFAEVIMFTDDQTYNSLGRRILDVYIQIYTLALLYLWDYKKDNMKKVVGYRAGTLSEFTRPRQLAIFVFVMQYTIFIQHHDVHMQHKLLYNHVFYNNQAAFLPPSKNGSMCAGSVVAIVAGVVVLLVVGIWYTLVERLSKRLRQKSSLAKVNYKALIGIMMRNFVLKLT